MALTKESVDKLGAHVVGHESVGATVMTATGMRKTSRGLIVAPSRIRGGTRTGALEGDDEPAQDQSAEDQDEVQPVEAVQQPAIQAPVVQRSRRRKSPKEQPTTTAKVVVTVEGFGDITSQYTHCHVGTGIVVLGCNEYSYVPVLYSVDDGSVRGLLELDVTPGKKYVYMGNTFTDSNNIKNIMLVELKGV